MKILKVILLVMYASTIVKAKITEDQIESLQKSINEGLLYKKRTGLSFENTVGAIQLAESSGGKHVIGDTILDGKNVDLFLSSCGPMQTQAITARWMIETDEWLRVRYSYFLRNPKWKDTNYRKVYDDYRRYFKLYIKYEAMIKNPKFKNTKSKKIKETLIWVKRMRDNYRKEYFKYRNEIRRDQALVNKLLTDVRFGTQIALAHLGHYYKHAKKTGMWNPYFKTISRYNGGYNNTVYYSRVMKRMKTIKNLIKEGKLKKSL